MRQSDEMLRWWSRMAVATVTEWKGIDKIAFLLLPWGQLNPGSKRRGGWNESLLYEVPSPEGDQESPVHSDEEQASRHTGCVSCLWH